MTSVSLQPVPTEFTYVSFPISSRKNNLVYTLFIACRYYSLEFFTLDFYRSQVAE
jgi:hypothetical protein